jgi:hypothetical protein
VEVDHALVIEMLPEKPMARPRRWTVMKKGIIPHGFVHSLCLEMRGFMVNESDSAKKGDFA